MSQISTTNPVDIVARELQPFGVTWHFHFIDIASGREFEGGTRRRYPICSCFKLAVLGAYLERVRSEADLQRTVRIEAHHIQPGGGVLNKLEPPLEMRIDHLLRLMMSHSDGTATDFLIGEIGMAAVQDYLRRYAPESLLTHNLGDMVRAVEGRVAHVPVAERRAAYRQVLDEWGCTVDYTHAKDLNSLLFRSFQTQGEFFVRYVQTKHEHRAFQSYEREGTYLFGKTGSFGEGAAFHDSAIAVVAGTPVCSFALMTMNWKIWRHNIEHVFGEIAYQLTGLYTDAPSVFRGPLRVVPHVQCD